MTKRIEISYKTIVFTVLFLLSLALLYEIRDILLTLYVALLIMTALNPWVNRLSRLKIPRTFSILVTYFVALAIIVFAFAAIVPELVRQTTNFINDLPQTVGGLGFSTDTGERVLQQFATQLASLPAQIGKFTVSLFSNVLGIVTIFVFAFYLLAARDKLDDQLGLVFGEEKEKNIAQFIDELESRLGGWARAQLSLMFVVGLFTYVGLFVLGLPFSLPLSILAGLLEIVPYAGPIISAVPAVIIGFGISPVIGFATAALYFLVQQLENYVFVPKIMQKSAGVSPLITLISLAVGFKLAGVPGLLISVPVFITIHTAVKHFASQSSITLKK